MVHERAGDGELSLSVCPLLKAYLFQVARRLISSSVNSYVLPASEVFGPPKLIIIMPQVYALPYNAHTEHYIYTFTVKIYAFPEAFVMF